MICLAVRSYFLKVLVYAIETGVAQNHVSLDQGRSVPKCIHVLSMHRKAAFNVAGASASRILLGIRTLEEATTIYVGTEGSRATSYAPNALEAPPSGLCFPILAIDLSIMTSL